MKNVLTIFEERIGEIFEKHAPSERQPFSFKRLAKRMVREMEDETFVIDGVDTAPALYTILVSQDDDYVLRPLYIRITDEMSQLIEAQAKKRGYTFVGRPLVRFMVDPALRNGRFSAFAENVDPRTLARLRDEENAYLGITPPQEIYADHGFVPEPIPAGDEEPAFVAAEAPFAVQAESDPDLEASDPLEPEVAEEGDFEWSDEPLEPADEPEDLEEHLGQIDAIEPNPFEADGLDVEPPSPDEVDQAPVVPSFIPTSTATPTCTLVDLGSGKTYQVDAERTSIGRERIPGAIVLRDPNVSRRHAELVYRNGAWQVNDLESTNGTLVNDVDVTSTYLKDGDVLTIGVTNLEFRAG